MPINTTRVTPHTALSARLATFVVLLSLIVLNHPTLAQPLFTITAQSRSVSANANCQGASDMELESAPDFNSWYGYVLASCQTPVKGYSGVATANQVSNVYPDSLSGCQSTFGWSFGIATSYAAAGCSVTFSIDRPLEYIFQATATYASCSLSGQFAFTINGPQPTRTESGMLAPGTYTFSASTGFASFSGDTHLVYTLVLSELHPSPPAQIVAGPFSPPGSAYRYLQLSPSNWLDAESRAVQLGGHLVTINDAAEQAWLESTFSTLDPTNKWIGLRTLSRDNNFDWVSGQPRSYTHWAPGRPDRNDGDRHYSYYAADGFWNDSYACLLNDVAGGIVELDETAPPLVVAGPISGHINGCPQIHQYYQLAPSNRLQAENGARVLGGHLVTINNGSERAWVQNTFASTGTPNKWIGLSARLAPGTTNFQWESGETPSYTNWTPGSPIAGNGDYVFTDANGLWIQTADTRPMDTVSGIVEVALPITCACDWNYDGRRDSNDFFAFLSDFFTTGADYDCSGATDSNDFFRFIGCLLSSFCQ